MKNLNLLVFKSKSFLKENKKMIIRISRSIFLSTIIFFLMLEFLSLFIKTEVLLYKFDIYFLIASSISIIMLTLALEIAFAILNESILFLNFKNKIKTSFKNLFLKFYSRL
ncbi:MAG: hypothetical protein KBD12_01370 [Candidatus Pacebacteria bacterium]|nr:hypothetical protein [Candidatus Paceibacterota bacterium]